jgi:hypothetical protein
MLAGLRPDEGDIRDPDGSSGERIDVHGLERLLLGDGTVHDPDRSL